MEGAALRLDQTPSAGVCTATGGQLVRAAAAAKQATGAPTAAAGDLTSQLPFYLRLDLDMGIYLATAKSGLRLDLDMGIWQRGSNQGLHTQW